MERRFNKRLIRPVHGTVMIAGSGEGTPPDHFARSTTGSAVPAVVGRPITTSAKLRGTRSFLTAWMLRARGAESSQRGVSCFLAFFSARFSLRPFFGCFLGVLPPPLSLLAISRPMFAYSRG